MIENYQFNTFCETSFNLHNLTLMKVFFLQSNAFNYLKDSQLVFSTSYTCSNILSIYYYVILIKQLLNLLRFLLRLLHFTNKNIQKINIVSDFSIFKITVVLHTKKQTRDPAIVRLVNIAKITVHLRVQRLLAAKIQ